MAQPSTSTSEGDAAAAPSTSAPAAPTKRQALIILFYALNDEHHLISTEAKFLAKCGAVNANVKHENEVQR